MSASALPIALDTYEDSSTVTNSQFDSLLGSIFTVGEKKYRLVQLNKSGGFAAAGKTFKWSSRSAYTVTPVTADTDKPCGVGGINLPTVAHDAYFLVQVAGRCELINGDDGSITAGNYVIPSADADTGKVKDGGTTLTAQVDFAVAVDSTAVDSAQFTADIIGTLVG